MHNRVALTAMVTNYERGHPIAPPAGIFVVGKFESHGEDTKLKIRGQADLFLISFSSNRCPDAPFITKDSELKRIQFSSR
jgi:hypothetical protein